MSLITHPATGFGVGDPDRIPLSRKSLPSSAELLAASETLILSASGWRKVFAAGRSDVDSGEALTPEVSPANIVLAGAAALVFSNFLKSKGPGRKPAVLVGIDSRPTGPTLADAAIRIFLASGLVPRHFFIVAVPEIMAYARHATTLPSGHEERAEGFCYVSASHNPPGHNGFKFGSGGGGVLSGPEIAPLIEEYRKLIQSEGCAVRILELMESVEARSLARVHSECSQWKRRSVSAYTLLSREVVTGFEEPADQEGLFEEMAQEAAERPIGVVAELNGSARCLSIDLDFLEGLGLETKAVNATARDFAHRIVPEGESLDQARAELEAARVSDPAFVLGYVPDCDGDRGNLVWYDEESSRARPLGAQEVFALACASELAQLVRNGSLTYDESGNAREKVAVVVNDATSMRVNALARAFDVDVFRSETGEANVVGLAAALREKGYLVRILGEGSNGGNITYPSSVRDPLATLGAILKLLLLRDSREQGGSEGLFRIWMRLSKRLSDFRGDFGLNDIVAALPPYSTTSVFETRAALRVRSSDQAGLKERYRAVFLREWETRKEALAARFGVERWEAFATNGLAERRVGEDFGSSNRGGLRIVLSDGSGAPRAFLWMRGSGTEAVFRIMADVEGSQADEEYLLDWHTAMVREADAGWTDCP